MSEDEFEVQVMRSHRSIGLYLPAFGRYIEGQQGGDATVLARREIAAHLNCEESELRISVREVDSLRFDSGFVIDLIPIGTPLDGIGQVAARSALSDDLLREILTDIVGDDVSYFFDGQTTEWLTTMCRTALAAHDPHNLRWTETEHETLISAVLPLNRLRGLRNLVVHGTWSNMGISDDETRPRPWGDTYGDPNEKVLFCSLWKYRGALIEQCFTSGDVAHLAEIYEQKTLQLAEAFYNMEIRHRKTDRYLLPRWRPGKTGGTQQLNH